MSGPGDRRPALIFWEYVMSKVYRDPLEPTPLEEYIDAHGRECPNPVPVAPPVGFVKQPSMVEHVRAMVRSELLRREVVAAGVESFEEADDFDIGDDPIDPSTPYEEVFDPTPPPADPAEPARAPLVGGAPASPAPIITAGVPGSLPAAPAPLAAPAVSPVASPAKPV